MTKEVVSHLLPCSPSDAQRHLAGTGQVLSGGCCALIAGACLLLIGSWSEDARADSPPAHAPAPGVISPKLLRYAERVVGHYDLNKNGQLEASEWRAMHGKPALADLNRDGRITVEELAQHVANYGAGRAIRLSASVGGPLAQQGTGDAPSAVGQNGRAPSDAEASVAAPADSRRNLKYFAPLPAGIPPWFVDRDADGDGQLTLAEYAPKLLKSEVDDFNRYDLNRDGLLTVAELLRASKETKNTPSGTPLGEPARTVNP